MKKTKAVVLRSIGKPLTVEELTIPNLRSGQVLVRILYTGICHTQLSEIRGLRGEDRYIPHTLGHEGSGIVVEVGADVEKVKPDDRVVISWIKGSGAEVSATQYDSITGKVNSGAVSTFMEYAVISENRLVKIPPEMPMREAALLGCAIPTGAGAILTSEMVKGEKSIAVFGVGGIGLSAIMAAALCNASQIIAIDIHDHKLKLAQDLGATHIINGNQQDVVSKIRSISGGLGVDCAIEAVGLRETMESTFSCVRDFGGLAILAGNPPHGEKIMIDPYDLIRGKRVIGTWGGATVPDRDIPKYVEFFLDGKLPLAKMISHVLKLEQINEALDYLEKGEAGRVVIEL